MQKKDIRSTNSPRALALFLLQKAEAAGQFSNIALDKALESSSLSSPDRRLASVLFYGVTERRITLDYRISALSSRPLADIDGQTLNILRLGLYQLMFTDSIPPHAAINETVSLCPRKTSGFVNGILRTHTRTPATMLPNVIDEPIRYLSVKYSVGEPLCKKFTDTFGIERTERIFSAFEESVSTTLRVNTLKILPEDLATKIEGAESTRISPYGLKVRGAVREMYGFDEGLFFVQDEASQICVEALDAKEGMTVLDICACPGSKSFGAAINMKNNGKIHSFDLHEKKLSLITAGAKRLGIDIINVKEQDGRKFLPQLENLSDRVLCDVPCSGFGVLAKKPELRYKDPKLSESLPDIQAAILDNACKYVKVGGTLVYSTCTVFPEENELNVKRFLASHPEFTLTPFCVGELSVPSGYITLMPDEYPTDGFFIAKMTKRK